MCVFQKVTRTVEGNGQEEEEQEERN